MEPGEEGLAAAAQRNLLEIAAPIEHAVGQRLLVGQRLQHAVLHGLLGDKMDGGHGAGLVLAPGAGDARFELGRIRGQIAVHHHAGILQVQARGAGVGAEQHATIRISPRTCHPVSHRDEFHADQVATKGHPGSLGAEASSSGRSYGLWCARRRRNLLAVSAGAEMMRRSQPGSTPRWSFEGAEDTPFVAQFVDTRLVVPSPNTRTATALVRTTASSESQSPAKPTAVRAGPAPGRGAPKAYSPKAPSPAEE